MKSRKEILKDTLREETGEDIEKILDGYEPTEEELVQYIAQRRDPIAFIKAHIDVDNMIDEVDEEDLSEHSKKELDKERKKHELNKRVLQARIDREWEEIVSMYYNNQHQELRELYEDSSLSLEKLKEYRNDEYLKNSVYKNNRELREAIAKEIGYDASDSELDGSFNADGLEAICDALGLAVERPEEGSVKEEFMKALKGYYGWSDKSCSRDMWRYMVHDDLVDVYNELVKGDTE